LGIREWDVAMSDEYEQEMETVMGIGCPLALGYTSPLQVLAKVLYI
jgi:hypothetical protein